MRYKSYHFAKIKFKRRMKAINSHNLNYSDILHGLSYKAALEIAMLRPIFSF